MAKFQIGSKVKMTDDALENYGQQYRNRVFTVTHVATKQGRGNNAHPGYDSSMKGEGLYDLSDFNCSLYDWELKHA